MTEPVGPGGAQTKGGTWAGAESQKKAEGLSRLQLRIPDFPSPPQPVAL